MMDKQLVFCEKKVATATFQSDTIDFGHAYPTTGLNDRPLYVVIRAVGTAVAGTGTLTVAVESSADGSTSWAAELSTGALTAAQLNAGVAFPMPLQHKRYVRLNCTVGGSLSAGTVMAYLSDVVSLPMNIPKVGIEYLPTLPEGEAAKVDLASGVTGTLAVANGGTGATTAEGARTNLGAAAAGG